MMERLHGLVTIHAPASFCYEKWNHFEAFPHFMTHVESVTPIADRQWHWLVKGPLGIDMEWDAETDHNEASRLISWHTLAGSKIKAQGTVRFEEMGANQTQLRCDIDYETPAAHWGDTLTHLMQNPQILLEDELQNFKHLVEGTNVPTAKVHVGKTLQPDPFVVPPEQEAEGQRFTEPADGGGYAGPYGLDNDVSDAILIGDSENNVADRLELEILQAEENPYLASEGGIPTEDLRDAQAFEADTEAVDIFTESYDTSLEDLDNYIQDLDEELDTAPNAMENSPGSNASKTD